MPDIVNFDVKQLIRVCCNDPSLRAEIEAALAEPPLPVRTPVANVSEGEQVFAARLRTDRDRGPGEAGFVMRDSLGWVTARLVEIVQTEPDASTISADSMADQLRMLNKPKP
jgi:hypothetical protein